MQTEDRESGPAGRSGVMPVVIANGVERRRRTRGTVCVVLAVSAFGLLSACGVVGAAGSVVGGAVDLTVDAVDTTTDVVTAPL